MADISQAKLEKEEGDLLSRRRKVDAMLNGTDATDPTRARDLPWTFGPLSVQPAEGKGDHLVAHDPDGSFHEVVVPDTEDPERIETVERRLRKAWAEWLDEL